MSKTVYRLCRGRQETCRTRDQILTSEGFVRDYMNRPFWEYKVIDEVQTYSEALKIFNKTLCSAAERRKTSYGYYFYLYEVLFIQKVVYDDDDEEIEFIRWLDIKASSINE